VSTAAPASPRRHQNLYVDQLWRQQRFFVLLLLAVGVGATGIAAYQGQLFSPGIAPWLVYLPTGVVLGAIMLLYRRRSQVEALDEGVRIGSMFTSATIPYESIRSVKALPLRQHFQEKRSRLVASNMRQHIDKPAVFIKVRGDEEELARIKKRLGIFRTRLMDDDTIAVPVPDADTVVWEISAHLPEKLGHNQGGQKRRKRRR
jgi:hypothetical protein